MDGTKEEKREFQRIDLATPLTLKILCGEHFRSRNGVIARNVGAGGLLFRTAVESSVPAISCIVWIEQSAELSEICAPIENDLMFRTGGLVGRVVRIAEGEPDISYDIAVRFVRKEEMTKEEILALPAEKN
ncbi:MAG: hypothetical protein ABIH74_04030 [Candidatus Omnitrophota bacterium]